MGTPRRPPRQVRVRVRLKLRVGERTLTLTLTPRRPPRQLRDHALPPARRRRPRAGQPLPTGVASDAGRWEEKGQGLRPSGLRPRRPLTLK